MLRLVKKYWLDNRRKARSINRKMRVATPQSEQQTKLEQHLTKGYIWE